MKTQLEIHETRAKLEAYKLRESRLAAARELPKRPIKESGGNAWGWLGGYSYAFDRIRDMNGTATAFPFSTAQDRRYGANWPFWRTVQEHSALRAAARFIDGTSPLACGILNALTSYVVGTGFRYTASSKDVKTDSCIVEAVQDVLDEFIDRVDWSELEQELFRRSRRDGEFFLREFTESGKTNVRIVEPEYIIQPTNEVEGDLSRTSFGVITDPEDTEDIQGYFVSYAGTTADGILVPRQELHHCKIGVDRTIKRGLPDFCFDTYDLLQTAQKVLSHMGTATAIQASIAYIRQHQQGSLSQVSGLSTGEADWTHVNPYTSDTDKIEQFLAGTILDIDSGQEYVAPPFASNVAGFVQVVQALLRALAVKWNAPEWIVSADASNNNMASSLVAEAPFTKSALRQQEFYRRHFLRVMWKVIQNAAKAGRIRHKKQVFDWDTVKALVDIQVESPQVEVRDLQSKASSDNTLIQARVKSPKTAQQEWGLDPETEAANFKEFDKAQAEAQQAQQGGGMGDMAAMLGGGGGEQPPQQEGGDEQGGEMDLGAMSSDVADIMSSVYEMTGEDAPDDMEDDAEKTLQELLGGDDELAESIREACSPNKSGRGFHDTETGYPCSPLGQKQKGEQKSKKLFDVPKSRNVGKKSDKLDKLATQKADKILDAASDEDKQKAKGFVGKVKNLFAKKYEGFKERYGERGARVVMAAVVATIPIPVPGAALVPILLAEGVRHALGGGGSGGGNVVTGEGKPQAAKESRKRRQLRESRQRIREAKSRSVTLREGFTGKREDKLGREYWYVDGKRVAAPADATQDDHAAQDAEASAAHEKSFDTDDHLLKDQEKGHISFLRQQQGGKKDYWYGDREFPSKLYDYMSSKAQSVRDTHHAATLSLAERFDEGEIDQDEFLKAIDSVSEKVQEASLRIFDSYVNVLSRRVEDFVTNGELGGYFDEEGERERIKQVAQQLRATIEESMDQVSDLAIAYSDGDFDLDELEESLHELTLEDSLPEHMATILDEYTGYENEMEDAQDRQNVDWEGAAEGYANELDDYGDMGDANEDAASYNRDLQSEGNPYRIFFDEDSETWQYGEADDLDDYPGKEEEKPQGTTQRDLFSESRQRLFEGGFTGEVEDALGRTYKYVDGKRVAKGDDSSGDEGEHGEFADAIAEMMARYEGEGSEYAKAKVAHEIATAKLEHAHEVNYEKWENEGAKLDQAIADAANIEFETASIDPVELATLDTYQGLGEKVGLWAESGSRRFASKHDLTADMVDVGFPEKDAEKYKARAEKLGAVLEKVGAKVADAALALEKADAKRDAHQGAEPVEPELDEFDDEDAYEEAHGEYLDAYNEWEEEDGNLEMAISDAEDAYNTAIDDYEMKWNDQAGKLNDYFDALGEKHAERIERAIEKHADKEPDEPDWPDEPDPDDYPDGDDSDDPHSQGELFESRRKRRLVEQILREAGFTGEVQDSLGRTYKYVDGKRVAKGNEKGGTTSNGVEADSHDNYFSSRHFDTYEKAYTAWEKVDNYLSKKHSAAEEAWGQREDAREEREVYTTLLSQELEHVFESVEDATRNYSDGIKSPYDESWTYEEGDTVSDNDFVQYAGATVDEFLSAVIEKTGAGDDLYDTLKKAGTSKEDYLALRDKIRSVKPVAQKYKKQVRRLAKESYVAMKKGDANTADEKALEIKDAINELLGEFSAIYSEADEAVEQFKEQLKNRIEKERQSDPEPKEIETFDEPDPDDWLDDDDSGDGPRTQGELFSESRRKRRLVEQILREAGFTGEVKDKRGRVRCYTDGKLVSCHNDEYHANRTKSQSGRFKGGVEAAKDLIDRAKADGSPEAVQRLATQLGTLTVEQLHELKKQLGIPVGGRKDKFVQKLAERATQRLTAREEYARKARAAGVPIEDMHRLSQEMRYVHNESANLFNQSLDRAKELFRHFNDKPLRRNHKAFREGDYSQLPNWDRVTSAVADAHPELFSGMDDIEAQEKLFDLVAAGPIGGLSFGDSYDKALDVLVRRKEEEPEDEVPFDAEGLEDEPAGNKSPQGQEEVAAAMKKELFGVGEVSPWRDRVYLNLDSHNKRFRGDNNTKLYVDGQGRLVHQQGPGTVSPDLKGDIDWLRQRAAELGVEWAGDTPGFTGTDSLGREWRDGKLVKKEEEETTPRTAKVQVEPAKVGNRIAELTQEWADENKTGMPMHELRKQLGADNLTQGQFHDLLRHMRETGQIRTSGWSQTLREIPNPEDAFFVSDMVMYYSNPTDGGGQPESFPEFKSPQEMQQLKDRASAMLADVGDELTFAELKDRLGGDITPGEFQDTVKALAADGQIELVKEKGNLRSVENPELMFFGKDGGDIISGLKVKQAPAKATATLDTSDPFAAVQTLKAMGDVEASDQLDELLGGMKSKDVKALAKSLGKKGRTGPEAKREIRQYVFSEE